MNLEVYPPQEGKWDPRGHKAGVFLVSKHLTFITGIHVGVVKVGEVNSLNKVE